MVLPVTIVRRGGEEKYLAHTLDLTEDSARLGGVRLPLEPGEIIDIHRRGLKAKFQVAWMGAPGTATSGQAGVRSLEPAKDIWKIGMPADEADVLPGLTRMPDELMPNAKGRAHRRYPCSGVASVRAEGSLYPDHGQIKDIARGGIYVASGCYASINTKVSIKMNVEGISVEFLGIVRNVQAGRGIGIRFDKMTLENRNRIDAIIDSLRGPIDDQANAAEAALVTAVRSRAAVRPETN